MLKLYHVFPNQTLKDLARIMPTTVPRFVEIRGIPKDKAKRYGREFLGTILAYRRNNYRDCKELTQDMIKELDALHPDPGMDGRPWPGSAFVPNGRWSLGRSCGRPLNLKETLGATLYGAPRPGLHIIIWCRLWGHGQLAFI